MANPEIDNYVSVEIVPGSSRNNSLYHDRAQCTGTEWDAKEEGKIIAFLDTAWESVMKAECSSEFLVRNNKSYWCNEDTMWLKETKIKLEILRRRLNERRYVTVPVVAGGTGEKKSV